VDSKSDARAAKRVRSGSRVRHERSAGGLVLKRERGAYHGLVIGRATPRIWSLPKGHVEPTETIEAAAVREVGEETSIEAAIIEKLADIRYWFYSNRVKHSKVVHFFLMRYLSGSPAPQAGEVDETSWVALSRMSDVLTHLNERRLVASVLEIVEQRTPKELGFPS
jgi:8-oxo-dGTP pyrophosphatase MutT (NUDIX family)